MEASILFCFNCNIFYYEVYIIAIVFSFSNEFARSLEPEKASHFFSYMVFCNEKNFGVSSNFIHHLVENM